MKRTVAVMLAALVTVSAVTMAASAGAAGTNGATNAQGESFAGAHVDFEVAGDAIANYRVDGVETFSEVRVQSQTEAESDGGSGGGLGAGAGLDAVVDLQGAGLSLSVQAETRAEIQSESGATLSAHDSERGQLVVRAGGESQFVEAELAGDASAEAEGDAVVVRNGDREGAFVVVGDGEVTVNDDGNVAADLGSDATLVFRSSDDGERDDDDREQEKLIADGVATAEVYAEERDGERVADVATYGQDVAVEFGAAAEDRVEMTVERAQSEGTVVITSVSEAAVDATSGYEVTVDGEAAAEASSYSELAAGIGEEPRFMVVGEGEASADVLVAIDHFSEREVAVQSADADGDGDDGGDGDGDGGDGETDGLPGFGVGAALIALLVSAMARIRG